MSSQLGKVRVTAMQKGRREVQSLLPWTLHRRMDKETKQLSFRFQRVDADEVL